MRLPPSSWTSATGVTQAFAVAGDTGQRESFVRQDFAGADLTAFMSRALSTPDLGAARSAKERLCRVACNYEAELGKSENPEGLTCGEALFRPSLAGHECLGIHQAVHRSIEAADPQFRDRLYQNIVLSGAGSSVVPGLAERLEREVQALLPSMEATKVRVVAHPSRSIGAWAGACRQMVQEGGWFFRCQYDESGPGQYWHPRPGCVGLHRYNWH